MRERLALWLHKTAFHLLNASDYLLEDKTTPERKLMPGEKQLIEAWEHETDLLTTEYELNRWEDNR